MAAAYVKPTFANWAHNVFQLPSSSSSHSSSSCIYLGPFRSATKSSEIRQSILKHNISAIINCTQDAPCHHYDIVEYCRVPVRDEVGADIVPYLWGVTSFMHVHLTNTRMRQPSSSSLSLLESKDDVAPQSVLVHCEMGISRSTTVVLAYLIRFQNLSKQAAYDIVKNNRPQAKPNPGFWKQLDTFEQMVVSSRRNEDADEMFTSVELMKKEEHGRLLLYEWSKLSSAAFITTVGIGNSIHLLQGRTDTNTNQENEEEITVAKFTGGEKTIQKDVFSQHSALLLRSGLFNDTKTIKQQVETLVHGALDYVWSRGVLHIDLLWFKALVDFLQNRLDEEDDDDDALEYGDKNVVTLLSSASSSRKIESSTMSNGIDEDSNSNSNNAKCCVKEIIMADMLKEGSEFYDSWTGEIYEGQIERVEQVLVENS